MLPANQGAAAMLAKRRRSLSCNSDREGGPNEVSEQTVPDLYSTLLNDTHDFRSLLSAILKASGQLHSHVRHRVAKTIL